MQGQEPEAGSVLSGKRAKTKLTFEDLDLTAGPAEIQSPYHGLVFQHVSALNSVDAFGSNKHSGFVRGTTSGEQVAYIEVAGSIDMPDLAGSYTFESARLTAGADLSATVLVLGIRDDAAIYFETITINDKRPLAYAPHWTGIDRLYFQILDETPDPKSPSSGSLLVIDDLIVSAVNPKADAATFDHADYGAFGRDHLPTPVLHFAAEPPHLA